MKRKILYIPIILTISINSYAYKDFGVQGLMYDIIEENGNDLIEREIKDINYTSINNKLKLDYNKAFTSNVFYKESYTDKNTKIKDIVVAKTDVIGKDGNIIAKKGDYIESYIPKGTELNICFIDGGINTVLVDYIVKEFGRCLYMVNKKDSREFKQKYKYESYPIGGQNSIIAERFNIKTLPTKIKKVGKYIYKKTINMKKLRERLIFNDKN